jgi:hypothetical protein
MKTLFIGAAIALGLAAAPAFAADNATATASANIVTPISVSKTQDLVFGNVLAGTGGSVTVGTTDNRSFSGGVTLLSGTAPRSASFSIAADTIGGATYQMSYSKVDLSGPGAAMAISNITPSLTGVLSGNQTIAVGATITVASGQTPGAYSGSITATATYE